MELRQVRYFLALSETLNFTRAAEECHVAQPTLTLAIQKLEDELGGPLLHRERANTHLTHLGQMVLPLLRQVYESSSAAHDLAGEIARGDRVLLSLGVSEFLDIAHVIEPIRRIAMAVDGLEFSLLGARDAALVNRLLEGELQLILTDTALATDDKLRVYPIYTEAMRVVLRADDPLARKSSLMAEDLAGRSFIDLAGSRSHMRFADAVRRHAPHWKSQHVASRPIDVQALCRAGVGVSLAGRYEALLPELELRPLVDPMLEREIGLVEARGRGMSNAALSFSRMLRAMAVV